MALEAIIDVAEIDDLGFRVVAEDPRAHGASKATRPSRALAIWGIALVGIASLGLLGRLFEPRPAACCQTAPSVSTAVQVPGNHGWPSNGHSTFRSGPTGETMLALRLERERGLDGSIAIAVSGEIDGPVGKLAVQLVSGARTFDEVTRHFSTLAGEPPSPFGVFDLEFEVPSGTAVSDLWIVARAYVGERVVAIESFPVDPTWPQSGPGKYVLDDVVTQAMGSSEAASPG